MTFYLSIIAYISSVIVSLVLMITGKGMPIGKFRLMAAIHLMCGITYLLSLALSSLPASEPHLNLFFLFYICSGTCLAGLVWRTATSRLEKAYFSLFALTFPLFLFSPSMLVNFLLTTHYSDSIGKKFRLSGEYYLEQQNSWAKDGSDKLYKLVLKRGIFHQTIARDIDFGSKIDSIKVIRFDPEDTTRVRGYVFRESFVDSGIDSTDVQVSMKKPSRNVIERRL
ncbi:MAG: hypothetical protein ACKO1U_01075 [Bacteroidota bacterium]